jgi:hypothetical protein
MSIIQQLEDLKEWSQNPERYERRLAFRNQSMPGGLGTEAGTIPIEWDELSDREREYYRTGPWSTREDYRKGQLVQPGPGRQGYQGNPLLGTKYTGTQQKGKIFGKNKERLDNLKEIIQDSNNKYKKTLTSKEALIKAGWKDGWQSVGTDQAIRPALHKEIKKLTTTAEKMDNYVNNVMLAEDALVQDFRAPQQHLAKKFGVSKGFMDRWATTSPVYSENKRLFNNLAKNLSFNKYKLLPDGTPRLMSEFSVLVQNKLPTNQGWFSGSAEIRTILDSAKRNYLQNKALGKDAKVRFITDPTLTSINDWQFIDNETGRLFSVDPQIDTVEFEGKTYKNNYLNHKDARKLYDKEFGNIYRIYDEDLAKYLDTEIIDPKSKKLIKLDTLLRRQAFELTGKKTYMERRMMEIDHMDLLEDPFGRKKGGLRLMERRVNQRAGLYKQIYKNDPQLLASKLDEIGYNKKFNNTDELIKFYGDEVIKQRKWKVRPPKAGAALDNLIKKVPQILKALRKGASVGKTGLTGILTGIGFGPGGILLEAALEGAVYEYYRRAGHTDKQAEAETFTYRLLKEAAKGKSTKDVPWYGGAEELLEKDLYQLKGTEKENLGKVIGERTAVKRYIDNETALADAEAKYNQLYNDYKVATAGRYGSEEKGEKYYKAMEKTSEKINNIKDQLDLDRDTYNAAKEKQETERGVRAIEYGHYGKGDTPELAKEREERRHKEFLDYRKGKHRTRFLPRGKLKERVEDPLAETPYTFLKTDETLPAFSLDYDPTLGDEGAFANRFLWENMPQYQGEEGIKRKWQGIYDEGGWDLMDKIGIAGGVANMAGGGIAGIRRPWAVPPVSGPMPQGGGLSSQYNRVRKLTG